MGIVYADSRNIIGADLLEAIEGVYTAKQVKALVAKKAPELELDDLSTTAWDIVYFWNPEAQGTRIPSIVLAIALTSAMPISDIADFATGNAFLAATTDEVVSYCPRTKSVQDRLWELGVELTTVSSERVRDFAKHLLINTSATESDWKMLAESLLDDDLRRKVVEHYIKACPATYIGHFVDLLVLNTFASIDNKADTHTGQQVARMHWTLAAVRKTGSKETIQLVLKDFFGALATVPGKVRAEINNLTRDSGLQPLAMLAQPA